ncbi:MAG: PAS domain S-box protein [Deltaproteobacteria bacterium]|nr:PAS domain S-box protein [Deltaproteobacteria bacterium]
MEESNPLYNSRIIKTYLEYIGKYYPDIDLNNILSESGIAKHEVQDPAHWFSQHHVDSFNATISRKTGNLNIAREAGRYVSSAEAFGPIKTYIMGFLTPVTAYKFLGMIAGKVSRHITITTRELEPHCVEILATPNPGVHEKPYQCENRMGMLESLVRPYINQFATIEHDACIHKGDKHCRYIVTWERTPSLIWKRIRNFSFLFCFLVSLALFLTLPHMNWVVPVLLCALVTIVLSFYSGLVERNELTKALEIQGNAAQELMSETSLRYDNALLVQELGHATSSTLDSNELCRKVMHIMEKHSYFDRGIIMLANEEKSRLIYKAGYGHEKEDLLRRNEFHLDNPQSKGPLALAFNQQKPFLVDDVSKIKSDFSKRSRLLVEKLDVHSIICVPIIYENESLGVLCVDNIDSKRALTQSDLNLMLGIASQLAIGITNALSFQKLKENEWKYRTIFESTSNPTVIIEDDMTISLANTEFAKLSGYSKKEVEGNKRWTEFVSPEYLEVMKGHHGVRRDNRNMLPSSYEFKFIDRHGNIKDILLTVNMIPDTDQSVASLLDITERRKSNREIEERRQYLEVVLAAAPDAIVTFDAREYIVEWNAGAEKLFGYSREAAVGKNIDNLIAGSDAFEEASALTRILLSGNVLLPIETVRYRKDGFPINVMMSGSPIMVGSELIGVIAIFTDITDRKKAETEKRKLEAQLQQAQKMESIGTLAGGIAHDFNNLLMGIQGNASLMLLDFESSHHHYAKLKNIEKYVANGAELTRQLLGFARGGKYEVKSTDINELIRRSSEMFGRTKKEITIHRTYQDGLWTVEVDQGQIDQVLLNIYVNAWQAMPGGGDLYIKTENVILGEDFVKPYNVAPGRYAKISVTDTGVGMDKATQKRIFDPFFTTKEMGRGSGLGLASAYGIITNHEGIINLHSDKGTGTTFNIYLPAHGGKPSPEVKSSEDILPGTETVLLVDDEDMILEVGKELLKKLGYRVLLARSGEEALALYRGKRNEIDVVILDMIMPEMGGGEIFDSLKKINNNIKVLLSSGYTMHGEAQDIIERGCNGFIQKPYNIEDLSHKLRTVLKDIEYHGTSG